MQLYAGTTRDFVRAATHNAIASRLADAFLAHFRYKPSDAEYRSWQNSLRALSSVIEIGQLGDNGILLEYQLPLSSLRLPGGQQGLCDPGDARLRTANSKEAKLPAGRLFVGTTGSSRRGRPRPRRRWARRIEE